MKTYVIDCDGHELHITDECNCAYMVGFRHVVKTLCHECDIGNSTAWIPVEFD